MKKVLITGAGGFVGAHLAQCLSQKKYKVIAVVHRKQRGDASGHWPLDLTDQAQVFKAVRKFCPDAICHLGALSIPRVSWGAREKTFLINVGGTIHLLEAVRRYRPSARILFMSSAQVYGRHFASGKPIDESCPPWPENPYAFSKAAAEMACLEYERRFGTDVVVVRALNIVGAKARADLAFSEWCAQIVRAEALKRPGTVSTGDLSLKRDFLHASDATRALELLLRRGKKGNIYNLASGETRPLADYMKFLTKKAKVTIRARADKKLFRIGDPKTVRVDVRKLRSLGWCPEQSPLNALEELLNETRKNFR